MVALWVIYTAAFSAHQMELATLLILPMAPLTFFVLVRGTIRMFGRWFRGA